MSWRTANELDSLHQRGVERYNARHSPPGRRVPFRPNSVSLYQVVKDPVQSRGFTASPSPSRLPPAHYRPVVAHMPRAASLIPPSCQRPPSAAREMMSSSTVTLHRGAQSSGPGSRRPPSAEAAAAWQRRRPGSGVAGAGRMARGVSEPVVRADGTPPRPTPELSQSLSMLPIGMHSQSSPRLATPASARGDDPSNPSLGPSDQARLARNESLRALRASSGTGDEEEKAAAVADLVLPQPSVDPTETELARRYSLTPEVTRRGGVLPGDRQPVRLDRKLPRRISGSAEAKLRPGMRLEPTAAMSEVPPPAAPPA